MRYNIENILGVKLNERFKIDKYKDALIEVTVGKFYKFDPSNGMTEDPGQNWVASGYKSVQDGDWYKVVAE